MEDKEDTVEVEIDESLKFRQGNISLVLDSYDDLFSDFDPRPYSEKALSDDFLFECKRAAREKEKYLELRLLVPVHKRKIHEETIIRRRLKEHFKKHSKEEEKIVKKIKREGLYWCFIGSIVLIISTFLYEFKLSLGSGFFSRILIDFLFIISQPAGWFIFWEGLGKIFIVSREKSSNYEFYKKMSEANINFFNY
jgi:hypothetical protein